MAAISSITLNDGQATPVAHTFAPLAITGPLAEWVDRSGGIALGYPTVSVNLRRPLKNGARVYRATVKVVIPVLEVTSPSTSTGIQPAPTKAFDMMFNGDFLLPERSMKVQRADLIAYVKNLMAHAMIKLLVEDLETVY